MEMESVVGGLIDRLNMRVLHGWLIEEIQL